jgi:hypothetical protein
MRLLEGNGSDSAEADEIRPVEPVHVATATSAEVLERIDEMSEAEVDRMLSELEAAEQAAATKP